MQLSKVLTDVWHWCCVTQLSNVVANYDTDVVWRSCPLFWLTYDTDVVWRSCPLLWLTYDTDVVWRSCPLFWLKYDTDLVRPNCPSFWLTYGVLTACNTDVVGHLSNVLTDVWRWFCVTQLSNILTTVSRSCYDANLANFVVDPLQLEVYKSWLLERNFVRQRHRHQAKVIRIFLV